MDYELSRELLNSLPPIPPSRPSSIYDIAGFPRWENVNSNVLAYYLDEKEDHGFGRLFLDSLLGLIRKKNSDQYDKTEWTGDYSVYREYGVSNRKRIDILVKEDSDQSQWAVIIENKIDAVLHNDLDCYYQAITSRTKHLVVLSIEPTTLNQEDYIAITHQKLVEAVERNIPHYWRDTDNRNLVLLQDYISHMRSFYPDPEYVQQMKETLQFFQENRIQLKELRQAEKELQEYIFDSVAHPLKRYGYTPTKRQYHDQVFFTYDEESNPSNKTWTKKQQALIRNTRFFVYFSAIIDKGKFHANFEFYGEECETWKPETLGLKVASGGTTIENQYKHIHVFDEAIEVDDEFDLATQVEGFLSKVFWSIEES